MSVINSVPLIASGDDGYNISRSVRLRSSASAYFNRTPAGFGASTQTMSFWFKRGNVSGSAVNPIRSSYYDSGNYSVIAFDVAAGKLTILQVEGGSTVCNKVTDAVYRDPSAWYHVVINTDLSRSSGDKNRIYVNGVLQSCTGTDNQTYQLWPYTAYTQVIGYAVASGTYLDGYLTEINFIDGQALTPSSFGETDAITGVWKPKKYAGTYGTNGFYLNFSDNSNNTAATIGKDYSGNGNNWTPNNISVTSGVTYDSMLDVPTQWADGGNGRGNYAVLNPLGNSASGTLSNANLQHTRSFAYIQSTIPMSAGQWYWEATLSALGSGGLELGILGQLLNGSNTIGGSTLGYGYDPKLGRRWVATVSTSGQTTSTVNDVVGFAFDASALTLQVFKNGASLFTITGITAGEYYATCNGAGTAGTDTVIYNFGQRPFAYTPPTGFKALNTQNLPAPSILKGNQYFDASLYTGAGAVQSVTNSGSMQPDLVWLKSRSNAYSHYFYDALRGVGNSISSDSTGAEQSFANSLTAFNSNGFSLGNIGGGINQSGSTFVAWQWKESATAGFDIVTYTGNATNRTISHGLGVAPAMIIVKNRSAVENWIVYHKYFSSGDSFIRLNTTDAVASSSTVWNSTTPTSSVFSVGINSATNGNTNNMVAYLFAEVAGFSRFGSYTGNGSSDGPFVFCGFRPRFIMIKRTDSVSNWTIRDTSRDQYNVSSTDLYANASSAESSAGPNIDILSNGFKCRDAGGGATNASGGTYIFAAFAEHPFKNALAR